MEQIKRQIQLGNLELARLDNKNQPVPIQYSDLESTHKTRSNYTQLLTKLKELTSEEKKQWVNIKKSQGNQLCKEKKWEQAIQIYLQSMLGIDITERDEQKLKETNLEQKYPIMLNIVTCNYQLKNYQVAIQLCDKVLAEKHGNNNVKAMYKKANCLIAIGELAAAFQLVQRLSLLIKNEEDSDRPGSISKQDIARMIEQIKSKKKDQKVVYQKMFDPKDEDEETLLSVDPKRPQKEIISSSHGIKQKLIGWCEQTWDNIWSCLFRKRKLQKEN